MTEKTEKYYVPEQSKLPFIGSVGLFLTVFGAGNYIQDSTDLVNNPNSWGFYVMLAGIAVLVYMLSTWWSATIRESMGGLYSNQMDRSFRYGMLWFITSEVMFFAAFFGALFYIRVFVVPWLGGDGNNAMTHAILYPEFLAQWPLTTTPSGETTQAMGAWGLPAINTAILLTSSWTLTIAHHALIDKNRPTLILFTSITAVLGIIFMGLQMWEYQHAYEELGLTLGSGIYGSTFFMLTGFHGLHVTIGTIYLIILSIRCAKGHFTPENHFAYEAGAWYWHFVDVVWLFLFVFVYAI
ncbi:cytochrome c oxidase subunit 3 [Pleionea sp. CnH1-48]|uniref:cytochrome c oxidase subunit 3 n=1 Tax=Pleionea sp. CnH1-48 TaxID=2954494 RepID=UPI00209823A6|nr:cytochrome c oxidase subunit 3 [Pleionea sp. CnH1-48]MCO7224638.1 cytochrome c oxidase subunit 3 [Pleionea sp. CnH1-48]